MERSHRQTDAIAAALANAYVAMVADALDRLGVRNQVIEPAIVPLGSSRLAGRAFPIVVRTVGSIPEQPYVGEMRVIEALASGDVLVYGGDSTRAALFGELFAHAAIARGAVGTVVDGYIRDSQQLLALGYPVFSRGASPLDTLGRAEATGTPETVCGGVRVRRGDYVVGDQDGIAIVPPELAADVLASIRLKRHHEHGARRDIKDGLSMREVWDRWKAF